MVGAEGEDGFGEVVFGCVEVVSETEALKGNELAGAMVLGLG